MIFVTISEATKEMIWLRKFLMGLRVVTLVVLPIILFCDNDGMVTQSKELRNHWKRKHIKRKYYLIFEIV